jgi:Tfp pilus assembly protein PilO
MTRLRTPLIALGGTVLVVLILLVGVVLPKAHSVTSKRSEVTQAESMERSLRLQVEQLQAAQQQAPQERGTLARLQSAIPATADLPGLIRILNTAAEQSGVDFSTMAPSTPSASLDGKTSILPVQITVDGDFFSLDQYLLKLEALPRAVRVLSVTISPGTTGSLQVLIAAEFFTTDVSAGPGSSPGATSGVPVPGASPGPTPSSSPTNPFGGASPSPSASP